ncbi:MAG: hypothetical protein CSA60_01690 [Neptuniibacter caesariensis]|uniref:Methylated-DNA-[protein]-cysteine S-methyltransferase DNA binding domain-containing protein n=1 Tax=Neptuniibacter caesariensis TaxID=207954 RepID=A0A2G6JNN8_NEPCE|nr:MAG: hypothetical protein CSA60_01690 [Neptuniibacter caesariensis]
MQEPEYQEKIWHIIAMIPEGKVVTYGQVAELARMLHPLAEFSRRDLLI